MMYRLRCHSVEDVIAESLTVSGVPQAGDSPQPGPSHLSHLSTVPSGSSSSGSTHPPERFVLVLTACCCRLV